jgi:hypothetical protein
MGFNQVRWSDPGGLANGSYCFHLQVAVEGGGKFDQTVAIQRVK